MSAIEGVDRESGARSDADRRLKIFINYRRKDAPMSALALHKELSGRFGRENVFLDVVTLQPGQKWLREIQSHGARSAVFLALIGPQWAELMRKRSGHPEDDQARNEIQLAFSIGATIIPTLVSGATLPEPHEVPRDLAPLLAREKFELRHESFDADVARLIEVLERAPESAPARPGPRGGGVYAPESRGDPRMREHLDFVVETMLGGNVVPILGSGANSSARNERWSDPDAGYLPDAAELAEYLAREYGVSPEHPQLSEVAQRVALTRASSLYQTLTRSLTMRPHIAPTPVHDFLASVPARFVPPARPQLIVTANYDEALERAFDEAEQPYDLAVYMATGPDRGHFVHLPYDDEPRVVPDGKSYDKFPFSDDGWGDLTRTVIVKIHGAVDRRRGPYTWGKNYVLTEDDYIDYLSTRPVPAVVPQQILGKLHNSHLLFLGYTVRDWYLRVFLQRIFGRANPIENECWAVARDADAVEAGFWKKKAPLIGLYSMPLSDYVGQLGAHLEHAAVPTARR